MVEGRDLRPDYPTRYSDLKRLIAGNYPLVLATWYDGGHRSPHFRVLKGYNDTLGEFIVHDPWYKAPYYGPDVHFRQSFLVDDLWAYNSRWAALAAPWQVAVSAPSTVTAGPPFTVTATVRYLGPHPYDGLLPATSSQATIKVPSGFTTGTATKSLTSVTRSGTSQTVQWTVTPPAGYSGKATIQASVKGRISDSSHSYATYTDWIGGQGSSSVTVTAPPGR